MKWAFLSRERERGRHGLRNDGGQDTSETRETIFVRRITQLIITLMYMFLSLSLENRFALRFERLQSLHPILRSQQRLIAGPFKIEAYTGSERVN